MRSEQSTRAILLVTHQVPGQGAPHCCVPAIWLKKEGYDITCLCPDGSATTEYTWPGVIDLPVHRTHGSNAFLLDIRMLLNLVRLRIRGGKRMAYYVYGSRSCPVAWIALLGVPRQRVIYHTQDFLEPRRHRFYEFFEKRLARRAGQVVINEVNRARFMKSYYGLDHMPVVVKTYLPASWAMPDFDAGKRAEMLAAVGAKPTGGEKLIMLQGAYSQVRCSESLLQAIASLSEQYYVVLSGMQTGSPAECQAKSGLEKHGLAHRAILLGYRSFRDLLQYTAACDIGVLLYANDGIGNFCQSPGRLTEYLRCGLPVVMSNFPNFDYLAVKYQIGVTCDPYAPQSIAKALECLASRSPEQVEKDRTRLRQLAMEEFCYEKEFLKLKEVVGAAIGEGSK